VGWAFKKGPFLAQTTKITHPQPQQQQASKLQAQAEFPMVMVGVVGTYADPRAATPATCMVLFPEVGTDDSDPLCGLRLAICMGCACTLTRPSHEIT
jgi:hypothetical protein